MKKLTTLLLLFVFAYTIQAQFAVTDPGAYAYHAQMVQSNVSILTKAKESIQQAQQTYEEAREQTTLLTDARDAVTKINNTLNDLNKVKKTIYYQKIAINNADNAIEFCRKSDQFSKDEMDMIIYNFTELLTASNNTISLLNNVLKNGVFKMTDAERIEMINKLNQQSKETRYDVDRLYQTYTRIAQQRSMYKTFGK